VIGSIGVSRKRQLRVIPNKRKHRVAATCDGKCMRASPSTSRCQRLC
jgi:hypothetical protein